MAQAPVAARLTKRRRCVLYLRAAGWDYKRISRKLGVSVNIVRKDLQAIHKTLIPGLTDGPETAKGYRLIYALGLLDAGVEPGEIGSYMDILETRADWLMGMDKARFAPTSNLADVDTGSQV